MIKNIAETLRDYISLATKKMEQPIWKRVLLGIMAGAFIALGAATSSVAMHSIPSVGIARVVGGCIFPIGLMLIVFLGGELFTGDCLAIMACMEKKSSIFDLVKLLLCVWVTNFIGGLIVAILIVNSGELSYSDGMLGAYTIKVAMGKVNISFLQGVCSGILCNIFVCGAVLMASMTKDMIGKILAIFFPIMAFVVGGFEHCVANMYYIPAGIFAAGNVRYAEIAMSEYGYTRDELMNLNWQSFLFQNELPVTIGNIIGGMVCIGIVLLILNKKEVEKS